MSEVLLAVDTATAATTVAVAVGASVLAERTEVDPRRHAEHLVPLVTEVLAAADLDIADVDRLVVGVGPGAFTGLRVGVVTMTSLAHALGLPIHGVVTLDALAFASGLTEPLLVVSDARRGEVFWAEYADAVTRTSGPTVGPPEEVLAGAGRRPVVGVEGTPWADLVARPMGPVLPDAASLARLVAAWPSGGHRLLPAAPVYLRRPDVTVSSGPKSVLP